MSRFFMMFQTRRTMRFELCFRHIVDTGCGCGQKNKNTIHTYQDVQFHLTRVYKYSTVTRLTSNDMTLTAFIFQPSHFHWFLFIPSRLSVWIIIFGPFGIWEFHFFSLARNSDFFIKPKLFLLWLYETSIVFFHEKVRIQEVDVDWRSQIDISMIFAV